MSEPPKSYVSLFVDMIAGNVPKAQAEAVHERWSTRLGRNGKRLDQQEVGQVMQNIETFVIQRGARR